MWRAMAAGSSTGMRFGLPLPFGARFVTLVMKWRLSADLLGAETRVRGSFATVLRYQLKTGLPSSPREALGCGTWLVSTFSTGPTTWTVRPRLGGEIGGGP